MKRSPSHVRSLATLMLLALVIGAGPSDRAAGQTETAEVRVLGLPEGVTPELFLVEPAPGGGYYRRTPLGRTLRTIARVPAHLRIEAAPIFLDQTEALLPAQRFQPASDVVLFSYQRHFLVTVSSWSRGGTPQDPTGGEVSESSKWVAEGGRFTAIARPRAGWHVAHWGIFESKERASSTRVSALGPTMSLSVDRPIHVVVGFVAQ